MLQVTSISENTLLISDFNQNYEFLSLMVSIGSVKFDEAFLFVFLSSHLQKASIFETHLKIANLLFLFLETTYLMTDVITQKQHGE